MNNVVLMGRLTAAPELKQTPSGVSVTTFSVAVDRRYTPKGQDRQTDFLDCVAWRQTAEFITKHFRKGKLIAVQGSVQTRSWQDKQGNKRKAVEIVVDKADFCGDRAFTPAHGSPDIDAEDTHGAAGDFAAVGDQQDLPFKAVS